MNKNINKFDRFKYYSEKSAKSERKCELLDAKEQWQVAELNAIGLKNREWCKRRAAFCDRVFKQPF